MHTKSGSVLMHWPSLAATVCSFIQAVWPRYIDSMCAYELQHPGRAQSQPTIFMLSDNTGSARDTSFWRLQARLHCRGSAALAPAETDHARACPVGHLHQRLHESMLAGRTLPEM